MQLQGIRYAIVSVRQKSHFFPMKVFQHMVYVLYCLTLLSRLAAWLYLCSWEGIGDELTQPFIVNLRVIERVVRR